MTADGISPHNRTLLEKKQDNLKEKLTAQDDNKEVIFHKKKHNLDVDNIGHGVCVNPVTLSIYKRKSQINNLPLPSILCKNELCHYTVGRANYAFTKPVLCKAV